MRVPLPALLLVCALACVLLPASFADEPPASSDVEARDLAVRAWLASPLAGAGAHEKRLRAQGPPMIHALRRVAAGAPATSQRRALRLAQSMTQAWHKKQTPDGMVYVPAGSVEVVLSRASERERVQVQAFYIDRTEVTHRAFRTWSRATRGLPSNIGGRLFQTELNDANARLPMVHVRWGEAEQFAREARGGRLPTLIEWQRAARGSSSRMWPWGDSGRRGARERPRSGSRARDTGGHLSPWGQSLRVSRHARERGRVDKHTQAGGPQSAQSHSCDRRRFVPGSSGEAARLVCRSSPPHRRERAHAPSLAWL